MHNSTHIQNSLLLPIIFLTLAIRPNYRLADRKIWGVQIFVDTTGPKTGGVRTPWTPMD